MFEILKGILSYLRNVYIWFCYLSRSVKIFFVLVMRYYIYWKVFFNFSSELVSWFYYG